MAKLPLRRNSSIQFSLSLTCRHAHANAADTYFDVAKLPKEVLQNIFHWATQEAHFRNAQSLRMQARLARHISHVNKKWREVALDYSELWTGPVLDWLAHPLWLETVLARSSSKPIEVIIPLDAPLCRPRVVEQALEHLARIRTLVLDLSLEGWQDMMQKRLLQGPAPLLEFCHLTLHAEGQPDSRTPLLKLNKALLKAPKLQTLELSNFPFVIPRTSHNLTSLVVKNIPQQSAAGILLVLGTLTQLEHLILERQSCSRKDHPIPLDKKRQKKRGLHLSSLQSLSISSDTSFCAGILDRLRIPDSCSTIISCFDVGATSKDTKQIFSFMQDRVDCWAGDPMVGRQHLDLGETLFFLRIEGDMETMSSPTIQLTLSWDRDPNHMPTTFDKIFQKYTSTLVQYREDPTDSGLPAALCVRVQPNLCAKYMRRLFLRTGWSAEMDYISTLQLHTVHTLDIFLSFMHPRRNTDPADMPFPHLLDLHLADMNLSYPHLPLKLKKHLKLRTSLDWEIKHLEFIRCTGKLEGGYKKLSKFVEELWIDGEEDSGEDTETEDGYSSDQTVRSCDFDF
ncbi:hypothetical protein BJ165DRAFT_1524418 [Panaeolus papilionaceus]|nr:hypothetical protein BJ165DRAFT_1524418 [Panaeolus papilionaceus]